jgi:hypothetical protein
LLAIMLIKSRIEPSNNMFSTETDIKKFNCYKKGVMKFCFMTPLCLRCLQDNE